MNDRVARWRVGSTRHPPWMSSWIHQPAIEPELWRHLLGTDNASVSIGVRDPMFDANTATWAVRSGGAERTASAASTPPDVDVDIAALSAAYLGAVSWHDLAASGAAHINAGGNVPDRLDQLFMVRPTPFCGTGY